MPSRVLLFHGRNKTPQQAWYPWFVETCKENGIDCIAPQMPMTDPPVLREWLQIITELNPDDSTVLVGHSRGGMAILRWLEQAPDNVKVQRVVLVAANNPDVPDQAMGDFYGFPYNFEKIKQHCSEFVQFHSRDDDFVPFKAGELNIAGLEGKLFDYHGLEHFGNNLTRMRDIFEVATDIKLPRPKIEDRGYDSEPLQVSERQ